MSDDVRALEQSLHSPGRTISSAVVIRGMFALAPAAADLAVRISAEQALKLAAKQATFGPMQAASPTVEPVIRLALFSQYPPGATGLPEGATTTQRAAWIISLQQVPAGASSHPARFDGSPAPTAPASPPLADVVVTVDATSGKVGGVFLLG